MLSAEVKQKVLSTFSSYSKDVELEARFGNLYGRKFQPGVSRQVFNRIQDYFSTRAAVTEVKTTDYIFNNIRKTVTVPVGNNSTEIVWIEKTRLWNHEDTNYGIRYSMSRELPIEPIENFTPQIIREKNRYSYSVYNGQVRIDLTIVNMLSDIQEQSKDNGTTYEVEIELVDRQGLDSMDKAIVVVLQQILDTILIYKTPESQMVINYVNYLLGSSTKNILDHYPLTQARNLKLKDMVWGGLEGNRQTGYSVTHKADGQRKLLVFHESGIWLVMSPHSLNLISRTNIPALTGTILDGEMIPVSKRNVGAPSSKIWYLVFDCICWNKDRSVQDIPHGKRMEYAQQVTNLFKDNNLLYINTKTFRNFITPSDFFILMRDMFREQEHLSYKNDGLMFTPNNILYNSHSDKYPLYKRVLSDYPDICKWKPKEELTIDFQIKWKIGNKIELYVSKKGTPVLFKGTKTYPVYGVDSDNIITRGLPNGTIVEYGWDYNRKLFIPYRVRHDKTKPNKIDIAEDVWMDIQRPLDKETMEGNTFTLLRKYHNQIKSNLLLSGSKEGLNDNLTLLDIGSGRGGDVSKWHKYSKIVAVEPNPDHIIELERRIEINGMKDKVRIVNAGGQDIETIYKEVKNFIGDRVDVVSMMLSMSFFWQNQSMVNRLINTIAVNIKPTGKIIFLTIDGDLVEQTFEPAMKTGPILSELVLGPASLTYNNNTTPKELYIHIEGTIVEDQTEWLVRLGDLIMPLKKFGFDFIERKKADEEKFLTEEEITMTQMYTYGIIQKVNDGISLPEISEVLPGKEIEPGLLTNPSDIPVTLISGFSSLGSLPPLSSLPPLGQLGSVPEVTLPPLLPSVPPLGSLPPLSSLPSLGPLPSLGSLSTVEKELPSIEVDDNQIINVSWYKNEVVVRIGAIGDGSCFFHAILAGYYPPYQNKTLDRNDFVRKLRRDIAYSLELPSENGIMWENAANGQLVALYEQQLMGLELFDMFGKKIDYSLQGMQKLLNSNNYLGDEVYQYVSDILGIDIYVMRLTNKDLHIHLNTSNMESPEVTRKVVVISGNGNHYETIGIKRNGLFQTLFDQTDPFIVALKHMQN